MIAAAGTGARVGRAAVASSWASEMYGDRRRTVCADPPVVARASKRRRYGARGGGTRGSMGGGTFTSRG